MRVVRRASLALLLAVVILGGAVGPVAASDDAPRSADRASASQVDAQTEPQATLNVTQEFALTPSRPGEVTVQLRYDVPSPVVSLRTRLPGDARVTDTDGFERGSGGQYHWDESTTDPTLTYRLSVNQSLSDDGPHGASGSLVSVDAGSWAMFQRPSTNTRFDHTGPVDYDSHQTTAGPGATGEWLVFLGDHDVYERSAHGQHFRFVVPANANTSERPGRILDSLAGAAESLRVGERDEKVFVVAAPTEDVAWGARGAHVGSSDIWVRDAEPLDTPDNAWLHEYVHSRQGYALDPEMLWFHEASASYYAALLTFEQGHVDYDSFRNRLAAGNRSDGDAVLASPSTWEGYPQYDRGALVAGQVDRQIRLASDGNRSLQSVFREMNEPAERTSLDGFHDLVREYGNRSVAARSERYATTSTNVTTWNESAHVAAFGPLPPDVRYQFPALDGTSSYLVTGPYRTSVLTQEDPIILVPGEQLFVDVNVTNAGGTSGQYNATLLVNGSVSDWETGTVASNETTEARLNHTFQSTGRHELIVGDDRMDVFVTQPADVSVGTFTAGRQTATQGEMVRLLGNVDNTAQIPANGTVTITRNGEPVVTRELRLAPGGFETVQASIPVNTPGETVLQFNGRNPVAIQVAESQTTVPPTDPLETTPTAATPTPTATPAPTTTPTATPPAEDLSTQTTTTPNSTPVVPASGTGGSWFGSGAVVLGVLAAIGLFARIRA